MKFIYKRFVRPILFKIHPEFVHDTITVLGRILVAFPVSYQLGKKIFKFEHPSLETKLFEKLPGKSVITLSNPLGLSAGFDKNGVLPKAMQMIGMGYTQVGSITAKPYKGNAGRRLYRLKKSQGLVVYYGLKNIGVDRILPRLQKFYRHQFEATKISLSVAKTNADFTNTINKGISDYIETLRKISNYSSNNSRKTEKVADMITINISCPNTFGGEPFTSPSRLDKLLNEIDKLQLSQPVFIKMPVDFPWINFKELLKVIVRHDAQGIVISNLVKNRELKSIRDEIPDNIQGGISGKPTFDISNLLIAQSYKNFGHKLVIVGVGGVFSAQDAYTKIKAGATLVQLITGMIYEGPTLIKEIKQGLVKLLKEDGYDHISQATGVNIDKIIANKGNSL